MLSFGATQSSVQSVTIQKGRHGRRLSEAFWKPSCYNSWKHSLVQSWLTDPLFSRSALSTFHLVIQSLMILCFCQKNTLRRRKKQRNTQIFSDEFLWLCPCGNRVANQKAVFLTCAELGDEEEGFSSNPLSAFFTLIWEIANQLGW